MDSKAGSTSTAAERKVEMGLPKPLRTTDGPMGPVQRPESRVQQISSAWELFVEVCEPGLHIWAWIFDT